MAPTTSKKTQDGYSWTEARGMLKGGLRCRGVVEPREKRKAPARHVYDAIVIGAGYAGLMAAREMTDHGETSNKI
jgi:NADPH-dependent 2,4-dienoyl-CoA reductase/sulfur reductase-like enzyme